MPPRHHYWTIILEGQPTAFRAHLQEELLPTLRQLQARHPDAVMKWFARGRLWESQDQERADAIARRRPKTAGPGERRPRDWRPGGEHKDPRERFKIPRDEKRRRFAQNLRRDRPLWGQTPRPAGDRDPKPWKREERERPDERPRPDRHSERPPGARPDNRRATPDTPGASHRPSSRRPPNRGGRPPGQGGRFGPRPQGARKPGGRGSKGGGGGGTGGGGRGR